MTREEKAAIKGYCRCGATIEQIIVITGVPYLEVEKLIASFEIEKQEHE